MSHDPISLPLAGNCIKSIVVFWTAGLPPMTPPSPYDGDTSPADWGGIHEGRLSPVAHAFWDRGRQKRGGYSARGPLTVMSATGVARSQQ